MDAADADARRDDLLSAIEVIEDQPLAERANAYAALHDDLARRLESGPRDPHAGPADSTPPSRRAASPGRARRPPN